mgnify:FL=1
MKFLDTLGNLIDDQLHPYFENTEIESTPVYHTQRRELALKLKTDQTLPFSVYEQTVHALRMALHASIDMDINAEKVLEDVGQLNQYAEYLYLNHPDLKAFEGMHASLNEQKELCWSTASEQKYAAMKQKMKAMQAALKKMGAPVEVNVVLEENEQDLAPDFIDIAPIKAPAPAAAAAKNGSGSPRKTWKKQEAASIPIGEAEVGMERIKVSGHIFDLDTRQLKSGKLLQMIYLSDYKDAIVCKCFEGKRFDREEMESLKKGKSVSITGDIVFDSFSKSNVMMVSAIEPYQEPVRTDNEPEKRTEWHIHTNFSEMDGVCAVEEFIQQAYDWGMDAIALTDHNVVQAFPMAQHKVEALKKANPNRDFKVLYGCEMAMVDMDYQPVYHPKDVLLDDAEFVIFDTETTGLSARLDDIIEFGAVKVKHNEVIDRRQFFINPKRILPYHITNLTHIHQADVDAAEPLEKMFYEMRDFIGDAILVAHNAKFDMAMINAAARKMNEPEFENPVIDTLHMAYAMCDLKSYRLGSVCKHFGVSYDGEGAHRADYDAEVLSELFMKMTAKLGSDATMETIFDLAKTPESQRSALRRNFAHHIAVFAKDKEGLKDLFELVTLSHTKYLAYNPNGSANSTTGVPRIPRAELQKYHDKGHLLFGSSCQNGEVFDTAHTRGREELLRVMKFYDFIEVQPLDVYKNLVDRGAIETKEDLQKILRFIIDGAKELGLPVIASSDAHYVAPHEKRVRDVYINAKAIGNSRHPLYQYNLKNRQTRSNPNQHLLTTREMLNAFEWLDDENLIHEIVIDNPKKLAAGMEELFPIKDKLYPPDIEGSDQKLRDICYKTAHEWYGDPLPEPVQERLDRELNAIIGAGYYVVYYISHLLVKKSNEDGYLVGSRGSVGSSFVATMSGITEVNPLKPHYICKKCHYLEWIDDPEIHSGFDLPDKVCPNCKETIRGDGQDIPFETFLGFEGDKVPDIDLNFSGEYQPNAHAFTKTIFGDDHVFRAGTVGTVQEKTAYGYIKGYEEEMDLQVPFSEAKRIDLAKACEGVKRTTGQHPGGIVVVPLDMDVHDFTPVQYPANNPYAEWKTTHFDFHQIHDNILKFDILGHVDPTAMKMMERMSGIDVTTIPMNDPETMKIFSCTDSLGIDSTRYNQVTGAAGIPEFGTPFVRGILELTKPTTFAELVSISGLSHGTDVWLNNAKDLIDAGICNLREVIGCRDDIMVDLIRYGLPSKASFTIMESVRKGKGLKPEWEELMKESKVPEWYMDSCRKIKYMFPKAHAVAYVMMAVRIAWFKVHMPLIYYCQYFSIRCDAYDIHTMIQGRDAIEKRMYEIQKMRQDKFTKVSDKELAIYDTLELALEMSVRGFHFSNMSIHRSAATEFRVDPDDPKAIIPPFTALDSLGENVAKSIVKAREERDFISKEDVMNRTQLSKTLMERLERMGAMEGLDEENQITLF